MSTHAIDLYELLPLVYRLRDSEQGYPLKALLEIIAGQADILKLDLDGLYDDLFIETCREWAVPYIGDLVGNNPLHEIAWGRRVDIAKTISYRQRKGVLPMLEELARDVTAWKAHASAGFELLEWTQNANHIRDESAPNPNALDPNSITRVGTVNLRAMDPLDLLDGPFDSLSHSVDVRPACRVLGRHNTRKVNFFLWRLENYPVESAPAQPAASFANGFYFTTLGCPIPLFTRPELEAAPDKLATELHVPGPIRPSAFYFNPGDYYGRGKSLAIYRGAKATPANLVPLSEILCGDLSTWSPPPAGSVAVDVRTGRMSFAAGEVPKAVSVSYNYGFSADIGGGPYDRQGTLAEESAGTMMIKVRKDGPVKTLQVARTKWENAGKPACIIRIMDNSVYGGQFDLQLPSKGRLVLEADNGVCPTCRTVGNVTVGGPEDAVFTLNGVHVQGAIEIKGDLAFNMLHCTMVPGRFLTEAGLPFNPDLDSLRTASSTDRPTVTIHDSIVGPLRLPAGCPGLTLSNCIVDAPRMAGGSRPAIAANDAGGRPGPPAAIEHCTLWGEVHVKRLEASETIFNQRVQVVQRQDGCVRFSYLPLNSQTPRRYQCQPYLALEKEALRLGRASTADLLDSEVNPVLARLTPIYTSVHYGDPAFAQLGYHSAVEIRQGAADGSEMGVFCNLQQTQRETNLFIRLDEYLPFGLEPGLIYVT